VIFYHLIGAGGVSSFLTPFFFEVEFDSFFTILLFIE
jgi:hypothetical protein